MATTSGSEGSTAAPMRLALAVLIPAEEIATVEQKNVVHTSQKPSDVARLVDPYYIFTYRATAWVNLKLSEDGGEVRIDLPYKEPEDLYELLETLYLLYGWKGVDGAYERVQRSLVMAVIEILRLPKDELNAITLLVPSSKPLYIPPDHLDLAAQAIANLIIAAESRGWPGVIAGLKAVAPVNGLFSPSTPHAETQSEVSADPEVAARLYADVLVALQIARRRLVFRVRITLKRVEKETQYLITQMLTDARATIVRETLRYFEFTLLKNESAELALTIWHSPQYPVTESSSEDLKGALKQIVPFAREVIKLMNLRGGPPSTVRFIDSLLRPKRAAFAREIGRHAQEFPVLSQIAVEDVERAASAKQWELAEILFSILKRAYVANKSMRSQVRQFNNVVEEIEILVARRPEQALATIVRNLGNRKTAWGYWKYIERAVSRIVVGDDITEKALNNVLIELQAQDKEVAAGIAQATGEMVVLGATSHFATRFVPVVNIALAAWHISTAVKEFEDEHDEFYCSLDPRDALVQSAPSFAGLAIDVATEAVFAFI